MSAVFFRELGIPEPDYNLGVGSGSHGYQTGAMLQAIEPVLEAEKPEWVVVYGDTNSTLAGALAAAKLSVPVAHVEAGVRSYNRAMAEEVNRVLTDQIAALRFCPTPGSVENLEREGIRDGVHHVGDVMRDALLMFMPHARERSSILADLKLSPKSYLLLTLHRAENVDSDERLTGLVAALNRLDAQIVFPAHPRTRKRLEALGLIERLSRSIRLIEPIGYLDMLLLQSEARVILTDSGGVQREAHYLSVPSVILRSETEWPELLELGTSRLGGDDLRSSVADACGEHVAPAPGDLFGRGDASARIARQLGALA
jgi:UDP-N-acetylglucosamine 2-epimerase